MRHGLVIFKAKENQIPNYYRPLFLINKRSVLGIYSGPNLFIFSFPRDYCLPSCARRRRFSRGRIPKSTLRVLCFSSVRSHRFFRHRSALFDFRPVYDRVRRVVLPPVCFFEVYTTELREQRTNRRRWLHHDLSDLSFLTSNASLRESAERN